MTTQTETFAGTDFTPHETITVDGMEWDIGICVKDPGWGGEERFHYAMAAPKNREFGLMLEVHLMTEADEVETFGLRRQTPDDWNGEKNYPTQDVPPEILERLIAVAHQTRSFFDAEPNAVKLKQFNASHTIHIDGQNWIMSKMGQDGQSFPAAWNAQTSPMTWIGLIPRSLDENGKIERRDFMSMESNHPGQPGEWKPVDEEELNPRFIEELERTANRFGLLGEFTQKQKAAIEEEAETILAETDMDRGLAELLRDGHARNLDQALETRDFSRARKEAEALETQKNAVETLSLPSNHRDRITHERQQREKLRDAENGRGR